jgi:hypothetical protein
VTFTAQGQGSPFPYQYRFWFRNATAPSWTLVQNWSSSATWTMPGTTAAGTYYVWADVRVSLTSAGDAATTLAYVVNPNAKATGVTLSPNLASPQRVGTAVQVTALGQGATGPYYYRLSWRSKTATSWTLASDWSTTNVFVLPATAAAGDYYVWADVRTNTSGAADASITIAFTIAPPMATGVTLAPDLPSPQRAGTLVTFNAQGQGSTYYEYRFWFRSASATSWTVIQNWGTASSWQMPITTLAGNYYVWVDVRTISSGVADASKTLAYTLSP